MKIYNSLHPAVSVIMPTYNRASYLKRSIDSVLAQDYKNWELVIVDDGGTDDSFKIINDYLMEHENIRYMKHKNRRPAMALNSGIQAAVGEYVTILCSDDIYKKDHLSLRMKFMQENPLVNFIHGGVEIIGDPYVKDKDNQNKKIHLDQCAIGGTFFCKRDVFNKVGGFNKVGYGGDANLLNRIEKDFVVKKVNYKTYVYYRDVPDSITNNV